MFQHLRNAGSHRQFAFRQAVGKRRKVVGCELFHLSVQHCAALSHGEILTEKAAQEQQRAQKEEDENENYGYEKSR